MSTADTLKTSEITPEIIRFVVDVIAKKLNPEKIIVFGSSARGGMNEYSDLDIFVVMESQKNRRERRAEISRLLRPRFFPIDIVVYTPDEFRQAINTEDPFVEEVLATGKTLYERRSSSKG
jgi:uncharacterized protein